MEEVKIVYCYDEKKNPVHYSKTTKQEKYYCIDCGQELICKEGNIKVKHLAHKNLTKCSGTGETVFHKHWKQNLFAPGMLLNVKDKPVEIYEVLNEVSLNKRYEKDWDIEIIVDVLLVTECGDVVVEINYSNPKDWLKLKPYYNDLNLLEVFEVVVGRNINDNLIWKRKDDILEKLSVKLQNKVKREQKHKEKNAINQYKCYFNYKSKPIQWTENKYFIYTLVEGSHHSDFKLIFLQLNLQTLNLTKKELFQHFKINKGIKYSYITVRGTLPKKKTRNVPDLEVIKLNTLHDSNYNKDLYIQLCNIN